MDSTELTARLEALEAELARLKADRASGVATTEALSSRCASAEQSASRRDVLRYGAVALGAAAASGLTARPAEGANGDSVSVGSVLTGTTATRITNTNQGTGIGGHSGAALIASGSYGVVGSSSVSGGVGVYAASTLQTNGFGLFAQGNTAVAGVQDIGNGLGVGVLGQSNNGVAIRGETIGNNTNAVAAIYGANLSTYAGPSQGAGGFGVYGLSARGHGLVGATATAGGAAVVGATNGVAGAYAAALYGPVIVGGDFTVFGAKSAAVPHPDGSHRRLYCVESPESWFEDFGEGQLQCGQADVKLDPDFAAVAMVEAYHVFVTGYDDFELRVTDRTATGFRVEAKDSMSAGRFSWRVVAKRKDIVGERLATVTAPPEPELPTLPPVRLPARVVAKG